MVAKARLTSIHDIRPDAGDRVELLRGALIEMSPVSLRHFAIVGVLLREIGAFVKDHGLGIAGGEGGFVLARNPDTLLAPDVAFIRTDRLPRVESWDGFPELVPDLVIEVVSPHDRAADVYDKSRVYLEAGVKLVVTIWPKNRTITVERTGAPTLTLTEREVFDGEDVLPGFRLPVATIFE